MISNKQLKDHLDFPDKVESIIRSGKYNKLFGFTNFSLCELEYDNLLLSIMECDNKIIIKHVIDNIICINTFNTFGIRMIHYLTCLNDVKLFNYFVNKYFFDLETQTNNKAKPIHFACQNGNLEIIEFLVNRNVDLESRGFGSTPIDFIYGHGQFYTIRKILSKKIAAASQNIFRNAHRVKYLLACNDELTLEQREELVNIIDDVRQYD